MALVGVSNLVKKYEERKKYAQAGAAKGGEKS
jgi:hypothetical protein